MSVPRKKLSLTKFPNINPLRRMKTQYRFVAFAEACPMAAKNDHVKLEPINRYQNIPKTHTCPNPKNPLRRHQTARDQMNVSSIDLEASAFRNQDETLANLITDIDI